jgi:uncharacterized membrane protein YciS (DUF1049 family)
MFSNYRRGEPFIYSILDWKENPLKAVVAAIGVLAAGFIFHCLITLVHHLRLKLHRKLASRKVKEEKTEVFILTC